MRKIYRFYTDFVLAGIIHLSRYAELISLRIKLKKDVHIFNKGSGSLSKYIIKDKNKQYVMKKNNFLIKHRVATLSKKVKRIKEEDFKERFSHLRELMKERYFRDVTTLESIHKDHLLYNYIKKAETADKKYYEKEELFMEIKKFIMFLKKKGYFSEEMYLHNVMITDKGIKFIDLEGIVRYNRNVHDIEALLNKIHFEIYYRKNRLFRFHNMIERGDMHIHTNYTDGRNSVKEIAGKAKKNGLKIIGITEHVRRKLDYNFNKLRKDIKRSEKESKIRILSGCETKVLDKRGDIDVSEDIYKKCEIVIGVVHSFKGSKKDYLNALKNMISSGKIDIWGHPLLYAQKKKLDITDKEWQRLVKCCKDNGVYIEFNARYKLPKQNFRKEVIRQGCQWLKGSDAHNLSEIRRITK